MFAIGHILHGAGARDHQRHMAVYDHRGGNARIDGSHLFQRKLGQQGDLRKAKLFIFLGCNGVGDIQPKAAKHRQPGTKAHTRDIAEFVPCKAKAAGGLNALRGLLLQIAEQHARQLQNRFFPQRLRHFFRLGNGQHNAPQLLGCLPGNLLPAFKTGCQLMAGHRAACVVQLHGMDHALGRFFAQQKQLFQAVTPKLIYSAARQKPRPAFHFNFNVMRIKRRSACFGQRTAQRLGRIGAGRLRLFIAEAVHAPHTVRNRKACALLVTVKAHIHGHCGKFAPEQFTRPGQRFAGFGGILPGAHAKHGAIALSLQITRRKAGA